MGSNNTIQPNKKWAIISLIVFGLVLSGSYIFYSNYINYPFFNNLKQGVSLLEGYPTYINGKMWRINQTNYIVWTKGRPINIETDHYIGNFSQCYAVTIQFNIQTYFISFNETALNYIHNETQCENA